MKILSIDTTSTLASVSVLNEDKISNLEDYNNVTHSERLLKLIDKLLSDTDVNIKDLDYLMTTNGPGSFTGSRIGVVTIKGLAYPLNKKIIAISSLENMLIHTYLSLKTKDEKNICVIMNAKNDRAYYFAASILLKNNKIVYKEILKTSNDTLDDIFNKIDSIKESVIICSDMNEEIEKRFSKDNYTILKEKVIPSSSSNIEYFLNVDSDILNNHTYDTFDLDITYARMSQAERIKNGEKN